MAMELGYAYPPDPWLEKRLHRGDLSWRVDCLGRVHGSVVGYEQACSCCSHDLRFHVKPKNRKNDLACLWCKAEALPDSFMDIVYKQIYPGITKNFFQNSPLLMYLKKDRYNP